MEIYEVNEYLEKMLCDKRFSNKVKKRIEDIFEYLEYKNNRQNGFPLQIFKTFWDGENPCLFMVKNIN